MKQELPIASGLLALGALLCWFPFSSAKAPASNPTSEASIQQQDDAVRSGGAERRSPSAASRDDQSWVDSSAERPTLGANATNKPADSTGFGLSTAYKVSETPASYWHRVSDPRAVNWLNRVAAQSRQSPPLGTSIDLTAQLFNQTLKANGKYFQSGQGRGQARLELKFGTQENAPTIYHMCDGRFIYHLESLGGEPNFNFVDLKRIEQAGDARHPAGQPWIATGELAGFYSQLINAFNFGSPTLKDDGTVVIRGCWKQDRLARLLPQLVDETAKKDQQLPSNIDWSQLPPQLPHGVQLVFRPSKVVAYFPAQFSFVQFESDNHESLTTKVMLEIQWNRPQTIAAMNDRMFVIDSRNIESNDVTDHYLARIEEVNQRVAENQSSNRPPKKR